MQSLSVVISDAAITRLAADADVGELRDQRHPLVIRFHKSRLKATWYFVKYQKRQKKRYAMGHWPATKLKDVLAMLPDMIRKYAFGEEIQSSGFSTVGDLLLWYRGRVEREHVKSESRRDGVVCTINKHLLPLMGDVAISSISKAVLDEKLMLPLQAADLQPGTIQNYFGVLKRAFASAQELSLIAVNPVAGMRFVDHIQKRAKPKQSSFMVSELQQVFALIIEQPAASMILQLLMLMFGLRIGETRQLTRSMAAFNRHILAVPGRITKTKQDNNLPLTSWAIEFLNAVLANTHYDHLVTVKGLPLSKGQAQKLIKQSAKGRYRSHDLRKLARSTWAEIGIDYWVAERLVNHKQKGQDQAYIRADAFEVKLAALQAYHDKLFAGFDAGTMQALVSSKFQQNTLAKAA